MVGRNSLSVVLTDIPIMDFKGAREDQPCVERSSRKRVCFVVSHPIQYFVPLYQRLSQRDDVEIKVFFTWHSGATAVEDRGFQMPIAWDIPLTDGYDHELVPNMSPSPGTHTFFGMWNPSLLEKVLAWRPDVVHISGWAWFSHLQLLHALRLRGVPTLFFGDSNLLDSEPGGLRWWIKTAVLRRVFSWPTGFLVVGSANRDYFRQFGVQPAKLHPCPHSIDVRRFSDPTARFEQEASRWRAELGIAPEQRVLLYAGKFESKKRPTELMQALAQMRERSLVLVLVGAGELQPDVDAIAAADPVRFRVLPFQNQSRMPIVYRLGDIFVLPSAYGESWGLAVNEAMACRRPVIVSDRVGCAADVVDGSNGRVFPWNDWSKLGAAVREMLSDGDKLADMARSAAKRAWAFDVAVTEASLIAAANRICAG